MCRNPVPDQASRTEHCETREKFSKTAVLYWCVENLLPPMACPMVCQKESAYRSGSIFVCLNPTLEPLAKAAKPSHWAIHMANQSQRLARIPGAFWQPPDTQLGRINSTLSFTFIFRFQELQLLLKENWITLWIFRISPISSPSLR